MIIIIVKDQEAQPGFYSTTIEDESKLERKIQEHKNNPSLNEDYILRKLSEHLNITASQVHKFWVVPTVTSEN